MAGVWSDQGIADALDWTTAGQIAAGDKLRLFKNNVTPANTTVLADLTEATFTGYAAVTLTAFGAAAVAAHIASSSPAAIPFTITAGTQSIYGWYVTNSGGTRLRWAQRDPAAPISMDSAALNVYTVTATEKCKDTAT